MKTIIRFSVLCFLSVVFSATAAPVVTIDNATNVYVDGVNYGQPADAIANNPQIASPLQAALVGFVKKTNDDAEKAKADHTAAKAAEIAELTAARDDKAAVLAEQQKLAEAKGAEVDARDAQLATSAAYIALLQKTIRELGGKVPSPEDATLEAASAAVSK